MRRAEIEDQNRYMLERQHQFRVAADVATDAWMAFAEVQAVAVIGSVAKALWKEVPRFREFRRERIEIWHECGDLDLALWIDSQERLGELRRAGDRALRASYEAGTSISVVAHQLDVFLIEPGSDRYLGRLCSFSQCPKGKAPCFVSGCGAIRLTSVLRSLRCMPIFWSRPATRCSIGRASGGCAQHWICPRSSRIARRCSTPTPPLDQPDQTKGRALRRQSQARRR